MNKTNDQLWKGAIEDLFEDFIAFHLPKLHPFVDFSKEITFLDKELEQIYSENDDKLRLVDKLVKITLIDGKEHWILVHIEIQGYYDPEFAKRMYIYYVRLKEKYDKPICAIAIFTDNKKEYNPNVFEEDCFGTTIRYEYLIYKVLNQNVKTLQNSENPFAIVIETVLVALKKKKLEDQDLLKLKVDLAKKLLKKQFSKSKIHSLMNFIRYYVRFNKEETNLFFEKEIELINKKTYPMGIEEILLDQAKTQGVEKTQKGVIAKMLGKSSLSEIAEVLEISIDEVIRIMNKYDLSK